MTEEGGEGSGLTDSPADSESEEDYEIVNESPSTYEFRHKVTGSPLFVCKNCKEFQNKSRGQMNAHLNPVTHGYCKVLAAKRGKKKREVVEEEGESMEVGGEEEEAEEDISAGPILKSPPKPVEILQRVLGTFPGITGKTKEWIIKMCEMTGDNLDGSVLFKHLTAVKGVSDATARYIVDLFNTVYNKEYQEFQEMQMAMGTSTLQMPQFRPPPGWGGTPGSRQSQFPQSGGFQDVYGRPQQFTPYGMPYPYPYFPQQQQQNPEMAEIRREMVQMSRSMERAMERMAEAMTNKPKSDDESVTALLIKELIHDRRRGGDVAPEVQAQFQELKETNKILAQKLEARELQTMKEDILRKVEQLEKQGDSAAREEVGALAEAVKELADRSGSKQLSDEAQVAISEIVNASRERTQFYSETRHIASKALDLWAAREGVRLTDEDKRRIEQSNSLVDDDDIARIEADLESKSKKKKK